MNLGIVGVGPWGRTIANAFDRAGVDLVAYDRRDRAKPTYNMGALVPWQDMIASKENGTTVDIIACAATPDVTTQVFEACQAKRKPCFLTKPFMIEDVPKNISAPAYVDYVQLASPIYEKLKKSATKDYTIEKLTVTFCGHGPERSFSGLLDYGAHALAFVHDLLGLSPLENMKTFSLLHESKEKSRDLVQVKATVNDVPVEICTGNGASGSDRRIEAQLSRGPLVAYGELNQVATFEIDGKLAARMPGHDPLSVMIDRFLWDIDVGRVNPYFLELSAAVTRSLSQIVSAAR